MFKIKTTLIRYNSCFYSILFTCVSNLFCSYVYDFMVQEGMYFKLLSVFYLIVVNIFTSVSICCQAICLTAELTITGHPVLLQSLNTSTTLTTVTITAVDGFSVLIYSYLPGHENLIFTMLSYFSMLDITNILYLNIYLI